MVVRQRIFLAVVLIANAALWIVPSNVIELIARDRPTLMGRYSREHFSLNVAVLIASIVGLYIDRARPEHYKRHWFQVVATLLFLVPSVVVLDFAARTVRPQRYIRDSVAYHRPANVSFTSTYVDRPVAQCTYPHAPDGYGAVACAYHTDANGFRNATTEPICDVVVLGDSFAEGSKVSDEHPWPVRLAEATGLAVCNLGMSGYSPAEYLASLEEYGLGRSPSVVLCMLYEGNDFRRGKGGDRGGLRSFSKHVKTYMKQSPVLGAVDRLFISAFGAMGAHRQVPGIEILDWLPLAIPEGAKARYYAFAPKQLLQTGISVDQFRHSDRWRNVAETLSAMKHDCGAVGATLMLVFAPTKAHVTVPLARLRLPAEKVREFAALRADGLAAPEGFLAGLPESLAARETVVRDWCSSHAVPFISTTAALRVRAAAGEQVYYTYDQHWTPEGHKIVAATVRSALRKTAVAAHDKKGKN